MSRYKELLTQISETITAKTGLWDNIRKKKEREGKKYKPAKPGDKDRPDPETWKKLTKGSPSDTIPSVPEDSLKHEVKKDDLTHSSKKKKKTVKNLPLFRSGVSPHENEDNEQDDEDEITENIVGPESMTE
jgi:hypothetical protein